MRNRFFSSLFSFLILLCCAFTAGALEIKEDYRSPRNKERPKRKSTRLIVLHTTEAHARSSLTKLSERGEAHYCVTEKGEVYRIIDRDREAFHAGRSMWNAKEDCDEFSVGIEVVGYHDKTMPLKQLAALKELVAQLKSIYKLQDAQVVCHSHVAYGSPNTWHKKKHRGRKRCGMLFAMPSVRKRLGLRYRPAYDPDVRAKRLVQADSYLNSILYGSVDTMTATYGKGTPQIAAAPGNRTAAETRKRGSTEEKSKPKAKPKAKPAAKPKSAPTKPTPKTAKAEPPKPKTAKAEPPTPKTAKAEPPKPKTAKAEPPGPSKAATAKPPEPPKAEEKKEEEASTDWLAVAGLKGGYFRKKAKLVVPKQPENAADETPESPIEAPTDTSANAAVADPAETTDKPLPLPEDLHVRKMGDDVKDLAALAALPGYTRGGPVSIELSPYKIAGAAWNSPSTYYYDTRGRITAGDKIDEKSVEAGTFIFYKK